ncbi:hypothetical protein F2P79_010589 [Pimephales promelas]|nr:hypothetical protein F2P79_010589 [Pimephales promelas]
MTILPSVSEISVWLPVIGQLPQVLRGLRDSRPHFAWQLLTNAHEYLVYDNRLTVRDVDVAAVKKKKTKQEEENSGSVTESSGSAFTHNLD